MIQKEFFGFNSIENIKDILLEYNVKNAFLVVDKISYKLSGAEEKINSLLKDVNYEIFDDFTANPDVEEVKKGMQIYKENNSDIVIAVGGGSVIDMAKSINILSHQTKEPEKYIRQEEKIQNPAKPLIAIPTTSGTGSEATYFATLYINKIKYSLGDSRFTLPNIAIIDPQFTMSMPPYLTASTGLDALCQGIESMWAVGSTDESRRYAEIAIKKAYHNLEKAVNNPDEKSRQDMAEAAHFSGKAICISKTTACHSISYPITSFFKIPHGHAVALTIAEMLDYNFKITDDDCNDSRGVKFVKQRIDDIIKLLDSPDELYAKSSIIDLMEDINVETKLEKLNIDKKAIEIIINKGFTANRMNNNPRKITEDDLKQILEKIL